MTDAHQLHDEDELTPLHNSEEYDQKDEMIERDRFGRMMAGLLGILIASLSCYLLFRTIAVWFNLPLVLSLICEMTGAGLSYKVGKWMYLKSTIENDIVEAFVTINPLVTLFGTGDPQVSYGPGRHWCYFFETRSKENVVSLKEVPTSFRGKVYAVGGTIDYTGTSMLRPDITRLPQFLAGAAGVASNINGLISAEILSYLADTELTSALKDSKGLNKKLYLKFQHGGIQGQNVTLFEERFGIIVGGFVVDHLLPSKEVQEVANAITEGRNITQMVYESFGFTTLEEWRAAVVANDPPVDQVQRRFKEMMIVSGNNKGIDIKENVHVVELKGLDTVNPELATALGNGIAAAVGAFTQSERSGKGSHKRPSSTKTNSNQSNNAGGDQA